MPKFGPSAVISNPPSPSSAIDNVTIVNFEHFYGKHEQCEWFWTPYTDKYEEGSFVDESKNESRSRFAFFSKSSLMLKCMQYSYSSFISVWTLDGVERNQMVVEEKIL